MTISEDRIQDDPKFRARRSQIAMDINVFHQDTYTNAGQLLLGNHRRGSAPKSALLFVHRCAVHTLNNKDRASFESGEHCLLQAPTRRGDNSAS